MIALADIKRTAQQLGEAAHAERVILFGSHARGDAGEQSDVDLLIIAETDEPRFKRSRGLYQALRPYPFAMDLVVYTPQEIEQARQSPLSFISTVLREGKTLYAR
jgi:predicted nucleotidyltransferase